MACWECSIKKADGRIIVNSGTRANSYFGRFWVAKITGKDEKYKFKREFKKYYQRGTEDEVVLNEDGIYEVFRTCVWAKKPQRFFIIVKNNDYITTYDEIEILKMIDGVV